MSRSEEDEKQQKVYQDEAAAKAQTKVDQANKLLDADSVSAADVEQVTHCCSSLITHRSALSARHSSLTTRLSSLTADTSPLVTRPSSLVIRRAGLRALQGRGGG
jgi:hypothetical protein